MEIKSTKVFDSWLEKLRDRSGRVHILRRLRRLQNGNPGDTKSIGSGVYELRVNVGPGYRVYYTQRGNLLIVLLCGGDKSTQEGDISRARILAAQLAEEE